MRSAELHRLEQLNPVIKQVWEVHLRVQPVTSALARPDILVLMIDETLQKLTHHLRKKSAETAAASVSPVGPAASLCKCGLNPLISYYAAGESALRAVAAPVFGARIEVAVDALHVLAHRDIEALCGLCPERGRGERCAATMESCEARA
jgi:hypothetical protein